MHGKSADDLVLIKSGFRTSWQIFNATSLLMKFDWESVLNNASLVTENDTFLPDNPTIFDSIDDIFDYLDVEEGVKVSSIELVQLISLHFRYGSTTRRGLLFQSTSICFTMPHCVRNCHPESLHPILELWLLTIR
jgi:hypothetical protein